MAGKHSPTHRDSQSAKIDDLKLINGIGPAVEKRLNDVGIHTFTQLAVLSPADIAAAIANLTGLSSERISKQDWIGQARKLSDAELVAHEAQEDIEASAEPAIVMESAPVVSPLPEPQQVQEQEQITEPISNETQTASEALEVSEELLSFIAPDEPITDEEPVPDEESIPDEDLTPTEEPAIVEEPAPTEEPAIVEEPAPTEEPAIVEEPAIIEEPAPTEEPAIVEEPAPTEEPVSTPAIVLESQPLTPSLAHPRLAGNLHMSKMEVIENESGDIRGALTSDKPFNVRLTLDLTEFQVPADTLLNYKATIHGKERVSHANLVVGEAQGTIVPADTVAIKVECPPLPEGFYRLAATVTVALPGTKFCVKPGTTAVTGGALQVY